MAHPALQPLTPRPVSGAQAHIAEAERHVLALFLNADGTLHPALQAEQHLMLHCLNVATPQHWCHQMHRDATAHDADATLASARGWYAAVKDALARRTPTPA